MSEHIYEDSDMEHERYHIIPFGSIREEIVRCRDCKWLDHHNLYLCMLPDEDGGYACWVVKPDGFCAWGERRGE